MKPLAVFTCLFPASIFTAFLGTLLSSSTLFVCLAIAAILFYATKELTDTLLGPSSALSLDRRLVVSFEGKNEAEDIFKSTDSGGMNGMTTSAGNFRSDMTSHHAIE